MKSKSNEQEHFNPENQALAACERKDIKDSLIEDQLQHQIKDQGRKNSYRFSVTFMKNMVTFIEIVWKEK